MGSRTGISSISSFCFRNFLIGFDNSCNHLPHGLSGWVTIHTNSNHGLSKISSKNESHIWLLLTKTTLYLAGSYILVCHGLQLITLLAISPALSKNHLFCKLWTAYSEQCGWWRHTVHLVHGLMIHLSGERVFWYIYIAHRLSLVNILSIVFRNMNLMKIFFGKVYIY